MAASAAAGVQWNRNPAPTPSTIMRARANTLRTRSERVRPARTAERAIGRLRKRSMIPLLRSRASPVDVDIPLSSIASIKTAGTR